MGRNAGASIFGAPPIALSMLHASAMCIISSDDTERSRFAISPLVPGVSEYSA